MCTTTIIVIILILFFTKSAAKSGARKINQAFEKSYEKHPTGYDIIGDIFEAIFDILCSIFGG